MLARSLCRRSVRVAGVCGRRMVNMDAWEHHGKAPLTKIVATIGPASEHMPALQQYAAPALCLPLCLYLPLSSPSPSASLCVRVPFSRCDSCVGSPSVFTHLLCVCVRVCVCASQLCVGGHASDAPELFARHCGGGLSLPPSLPPSLPRSLPPSPLSDSVPLSVDCRWSCVSQTRRSAVGSPPMYLGRAQT